MKNNLFVSRANGAAPLKMISALLLYFGSAVLSGVVPAGFGGVLFICAASGLLAYALTAKGNVFFLLLSAAVSVGVSVLVGASFPLALSSLIYVPLAVIISAGVRRSSGLFGTVAAMTATVCMIFGAIVGVAYLRDSAWVGSAANDFLSAFRELFHDYVDVLTTQMGSSEPLISDTAVDQMVDMTVMLLPAIAVCVLQIFCYAAAKVFRLAALIGGSNALFAEGEWGVAVSLPASLIFAASLLVSAFGSGVDVVFYVSASLMLIFLPGTALYGFNMMFGKKSHFKNGMHPFGRLMLIGLCMVCFYMGGFTLVIIAALFAVYYNVRRFLALRSKKDKED